jgi:HTH-type transcriptional regulator, cell division transcriptional repressor
VTDWYGEEQATLGDRIAAAREAAALSLEDLAQRLGVRATTVRAWENDRAEPRGNRLQMLAGMLNVPLAWLMTGEGNGLAAPEEGAPPSDLSKGLHELKLLRQGMSEAVKRIDRLEAQLRSAVR